MVFIAIFYSQKVLNDLRMDANWTPSDVKRGFAIYFQSQKVNILRPTAPIRSEGPVGNRSNYVRFARERSFITAMKKCNLAMIQT